MNLDEEIMKIEGRVKGGRCVNLIAIKLWKERVKTKGLKKKKNLKYPLFFFMLDHGTQNEFHW